MAILRRNHPLWPASTSNSADVGGERLSVDFGKLRLFVIRTRRIGNGFATTGKTFVGKMGSRR
jgi:hypothetical protein